MDLPRAFFVCGILGVGLALCVTVTGSAAAETPEQNVPPGMVWIAGGEFHMGSTSELARRDEKPVHRVRLEGFWMDATEVTNAQLRQFIEATGYVTTAEQAPKLEEIMAQLPPVLESLTGVKFEKLLQQIPALKNAMGKDDAEKAG